MGPDFFDSLSDISFVVHLLVFCFQFKIVLYPAIRPAGYPVKSQNLMFLLRKQWAKVLLSEWFFVKIMYCLIDLFHYYFYAQ